METPETTRYRFDESGTLEKPGPLGRIIRFLLGLFCLYLLFILFTEGTWLISTTLPRHPGWWLAMGGGLMLLPDVVNIGFGRSWGRWPQGVVGLVVVGLVVFSLVQYGSVWSPALGWFVLVWLLYLYTHLGISLILASAIATPGCEMRAIPHLWRLITRRDTADHYCPGFIGRVDRWEARIRGPGKEGEQTAS